ncbi:MAG: HlyC/CorC family transporter, partial [Deltaproteobacteria bacterium]|nr:HlyC/CorC family transporter [Candidatus Zymogenus saltonus]
MEREISSFIFEAALIFILIVANGFFAGSEIAIVTMRKSRIKTLREEKRHKSNAEKLLHIKDDPDGFLSTIQIGITLIGSLASAVGGAAAVQLLTPIIRAIKIEALSAAAQPISIFIVVIVISYFMLVLGELVPKSLGIRFSEKISLFVVGPIIFVAKIISPLIKLLTFSNNVVLKALGMKGRADSSFFTEEEIILILKEGEEKGVLDETEHELIHSIFDFTDRQVKDVMVPHPKINAVDIDWKKDKILKFIVNSGKTRYPVYKDNLDNVVGVLNNKDVLYHFVNKKAFEVEKLMKQAHFVPESKMISELLREMQNSRIQMVLVVDEYGDIAGLATMEDLLEEIVGEIEDEHDIESSGVVGNIEDGTMV